MSHVVKIEFFDLFLKKCKGTAMQFKKLWHYDCFDVKTKTLKILRCV